VIEVRLFGALQRYAPDPTLVPGTAIRLQVQERGTLGQVLAHMEIDPAEVSNVFLNGRLLPRSAYPITLGYPLAAERPLSPVDYLQTQVRAGDRVGIFPSNMGLVVV
jgi:hypothetical protein